MSKFTTVITNFQRLEQLKGCVESLRPSEGKMDVVVATFGGGVQHRMYLKDSGVTDYFVTPKDYGCNQLWIKALELAKTRWVSILHDDDRRPPGFADEVNKLIREAELKSCGFIAWNGAQLDLESGEVSGNIPIAAVKDGVWDSSTLIPMLKMKGTLPNSPVSFIFDRETALDALYWAEENLKDCVTRPSMMVGNDVMLVWAHVMRYSMFLQSSKQLSWYGHWDGSETIQFASGKNAALMECYDKTRSRLPKSIPTRANAVSRAFKGKIVHVWSDYLSVPCDPETERRNAFARETWADAYKSGNWVPHRVTKVGRTSQSAFGDTRDLPFVKDMLRQAMDLCQKNDIVLLTNADICLMPDIESQVVEAVSRAGACHAARWNFAGRLTKKLKTAEELKKGVWFAGTDLVAFTKEWLEQHLDEFPDIVLACECWDLVMRNLIKVYSGIELHEAIYHEIHQAYWYKPQHFKTNPGNEHNRKLSESWFNKYRAKGANDQDWREEINRREKAAGKKQGGMAVDGELRFNPRTGAVLTPLLPLSMRTVRIY